MRIIKSPTVKKWAKDHPSAKPSLHNWLALVRAARWNTFVELRATFRSADQVAVASGRTVVVFNIAGNNFRLIAAVHFKTHIVFTLRFLTHAEYDTDRWRSDL